MSTAPPLPDSLLDPLRNHRHIGPLTIDTLKVKWQEYFDRMELEWRKQPDFNLVVGFSAIGFCSGFVAGLVHASLHGLE